MNDNASFQYGEVFDSLGLGNDFLDMMQMFEVDDQFAQQCMNESQPEVDITSDVFPLFNDDGMTDNGLLFGISDYPTIFDESYLSIDHASIKNDDLPFFCNDIGQPGDGAPDTEVPHGLQPGVTGPNFKHSVLVLIKSKKRKLEDCLSQFVGVQSPVRKVAQRKKFRPERLKQVNQVRKCKLDLPCTSCLNLGKSPGLGRALCIRQKLLDVRFAGDLWNQNGDFNWLQKEVTSLSGPKAILRISVYKLCDADHKKPWEYADWTVANPLEIEVQAFEPRLGKHLKHILQGYADLSISAVSCTTNPNELQHYAIPEKSLPSLEVLETWALNTTKHHRYRLFGSIRASFLSLARRYCECDKILPLKSLVWKAIRLSCLHGIWIAKWAQTRKSRSDPKRYASSAVHRQIGLIVAKGIVDLEVDLLSQLQKTLFGVKGPGKNNMLPIWTCLWLLILTYRRTNQYWAREPLSGGCHMELSQHMYDMLVSIYSGLFRPSSPLWSNWLKSDVSDLFGRDPGIMERMGNLKTEMCFCYSEEKAYQHSRDKLLRTLIFDYESKRSQKLPPRPPGWDDLIQKHWCSSVKPSGWVSLGCYKNGNLI